MNQFDRVSLGTLTINLNRVLFARKTSGGVWVALDAPCEELGGDSSRRGLHLSGQEAEDFWAVYSADISEELQEEGKKLSAKAQHYAAVTEKRYSNSRAIRRRNITAQAVRDAAEDVRIYNQAYDATVSKALNDHTQGFDAQ